MTLNEYQERAMTTCLPTCENFSYMMLNLVGEVGELAGNIAKHIRKKEMRINNNDLRVAEQMCYNADGTTKSQEQWEQEKANLVSEIGDCLWQLSGLCQVMGLSLEDVAKANLNKLASRKQRGVIYGEGDNR